MSPVNKTGTPDKADEAELQALVDGVAAGNRTMLGRAITLIETTLGRKRSLAERLVARLLPAAGKAHRIGITGAPGVGKSTLVDALGMHLIEAGHKVAVLAVDPSSSRTGGSILGDKTRMHRLANNPAAFIRPSPASGVLGGVARRTRDTITACEAAGFDVILVETVGVGQSEALVDDLVDSFVVLVLAGGGDELQGIKRGILELADMVAITKADGDNVEPARRATQMYRSALELVPPKFVGWKARVLRCSALASVGISDLWEGLIEHRRALVEAGEWDERRRQQSVRALWRAVEDELVAALRADPDVRSLLPEIERSVCDGTITPDGGAARLLDAFRAAARSRP